MYVPVQRRIGGDWFGMLLLPETDHWTEAYLTVVTHYI
jgi:hypothetical protein